MLRIRSVFAPKHLREYTKLLPEGIDKTGRRTCMLLLRNHGKKANNRLLAVAWLISQSPLRGGYFLNRSYTSSISLKASEPIWENGHKGLRKMALPCQLMQNACIYEIKDQQEDGDVIDSAPSWSV